MEPEIQKETLVQEEINNKNLERARKTSFGEGSAAAVMDGFGTRYITPYAIALKSSNFAISVLSSLPQLLGNIAQIFNLRLLKKYSRKKIVATTVLSQTLLWIPVIVIGLLYYHYHLPSNISILLLIIIYTLLVASGNSGSPAWNSWMKDIVKDNKGSYFGNRNRLINFITILSLIISGIILNYFTAINIIWGFAIIFFIAFIGRLISSILITRQFEPEYKFNEESYFNIFEFIKKMKGNNFGRFVILISLISFATAIASPFFSVYMLEELHFSYLAFTLVVLAPIVTTVIFMPIWGRYADKVGNVKVLKLTGLLIPLTPFMWLGTIFLLKYHMTNWVLPYLIIMEMISGFNWSGFNLSAANFIFDAVSRERMAICVAYYNLINNAGAFFGAILGGIVTSIDFHLTISSIIIVFIISFILRYVFYFLMIKKIKEVKKVEELDFDDHFKKEFKDHSKKVKSTIKDIEKGIKKVFTFDSEGESQAQIQNYAE